MPRSQQITRRRSRSRSGAHSQGPAPAPARVQRTLATLQAVPAAPVRPQAADILELQRTVGNRAVDRLLRQQAGSAALNVTPAPAGSVQRVSEATKKRNRQKYEKEVRDNVTFALENSDGNFTAAQLRILTEMIMEERAVFPPLDDPVYDKEETAFDKDSERRQYTIMVTVAEAQEKLVPFLHRREWMQRYAKEHRATIEQGKMLAERHRQAPDKVPAEVLNGVCFAASIYWLREVKKKPKLAVSEVLGYINSEAGLQELVAIQRQHHAFIDSQKHLAWMYQSSAGLPEEVLAQQGMRAMEDPILGDTGNLGALFGWIQQHTGRLDKKGGDFRFMLRLYPSGGGSGHAIAFQFRRRTGLKDHLQVNMLDMNQTLMKIKKLKWGEERSWERVNTIIGEYLATYQSKYDRWRVVSYL